MEKAKVEALLDDVARHLKRRDGGELPTSQRGVLYACLHNDNPPYRQMPDTLLSEGYGRYAWKTLKNDGSIIFNRLTDAFGETIKKNNCSRKLVDWHQNQCQSLVRLANVSTSSPPPSSSPQFNNQPNNLLQFKRWNADLERLTTSIFGGQRVVCINGSARIGKTYFTRALVNRLKTAFETVLWYQASDIPTVGMLYQRVLMQLNQQQGGSSSFTQFSIQGDADHRTIPAIPALLELLQTQRILLIIDQTDVLYQAHQFAGQFKSDSIDYEQWLKRLLECPFSQGCLIWAGREPPACFDVQYGTLVWHQVQGLMATDAKALLKMRGSSIDRWQDWDRLVTFCGGNPAWVVMEAMLMQRSHPENISDFLDAPSLAQTITQILTDYISKLSTAEYGLLWWLLLKPLSFSEVRSLQSPNLLPSTLENALISLERRCLVTQNEHQRYRLNPPLLEFVLADYGVEKSVADISHQTFGQLHHYPLFHGTASAQRQQWQHTHILQAIANRLRNQYGGLRHDHLTYLQPLLSLARHQPHLRNGYSISNLVNIAVTLHLPLNQFELNHLPIHHVDLRQAILSQTKFDHCQFHNTLLPLPVAGPFVADMTPEGDAIAIGSQNGYLLLWRQQADTLRLQADQLLSAPIEQVLFQDQRTVLVISDQTLYSWWLDEPNAPTPLVSLPAQARCIAQSPLGYIAIGLTTGQIILWDDMSGQTQTLEAHGAEVYNLAFSPDSYSLVSIGVDSRMVMWDLTTIAEKPTYREWSSWGNIGCTVSWDDNTLLCAEIEFSRIRLRTAQEQLREHLIPGNTIITFCFSKNGRYLMGSSTHQHRGGFLFCWEWKTGQFQSIYQPHLPSEALSICSQGHWFLTAQSNSIQLIDFYQSECVWQLTTHQADGIPDPVQDVHGLTDTEKRLLFKRLES